MTTTSDDNIVTISAIGRIQKALFLLQMNRHKPKVKPVTKLRHMKDLRDACAAYVDWYDNN